MLTVLTVLSALVRILITLLPARPSCLKASSMPSVQFPASREFSREFFGKEPQRNDSHVKSVGSIKWLRANYLLRSTEFLLTEQGSSSREQGMGDGWADPTLWLERDTALIGGQRIIEGGAVRERGPSGGRDCGPHR